MRASAERQPKRSAERLNGSAESPRSAEGPKGYPLDTMFNQRHIEVDQKSKSLSGQLQFVAEAHFINMLQQARAKDAMKWVEATIA